MNPPFGLSLHLIQSTLGTTGRRGGFFDTALPFFGIA